MRKLAKKQKEIPMTEKLKNIGYNPANKKEQLLLLKLDKINLKMRDTPIKYDKSKNI